MQYKRDAYRDRGDQKDVDEISHKIKKEVFEDLNNNSNVSVLHCSFLGYILYGLPFIIMNL